MRIDWIVGLLTLLSRSECFQPDNPVAGEVFFVDFPSYRTFRYLQHDLRPITEAGVKGLEERPRTFESFELMQGRSSAGSNLPFTANIWSEKISSQRTMELSAKAQLATACWMVDHRFVNYVES